MTTDPATKLLWDAQRAAERIARFTTGRSLEDYRADGSVRTRARSDAVR